MPGDPVSRMFAQAQGTMQPDQIAQLRKLFGLDNRSPMPRGGSRRTRADGACRHRVASHGTLLAPDGVADAIPRLKRVSTRTTMTQVALFTFSQIRATLLEPTPSKGAT
jgi:hypothetical protein